MRRSSLGSSLQHAISNPVSLNYKGRWSMFTNFLLTEYPYAFAPAAHTSLVPTDPNSTKCPHNACLSCLPSVHIPSFLIVPFLRAVVLIIKAHAVSFLYVNQAGR
jgi:hypothetical protein